MPLDLSRRNRQPERMDQPGLDPREHARALAGLRRINAWSRTAHYVWRTVSRVARRRGLASLRVLDLASGGGDLAFRLAAAAESSGVAAAIHGADLSPTAVDYANRRAEQRGLESPRFHVLDALNDPLPPDYDIVTCTLFLHHLDEGQATDLLRRAAAAARHAVVVDDLLRSRIGYGLAVAGCRVLSRSPTVHFDGPVSVEGAYSLAEARRLADAAGLHGAQISRHWPERFQLVWERNGEP